MQRRHYVAALTAAALAGCQALSDGEPTEPSESTPTPDLDDGDPDDGDSGATPDDDPEPEGEEDDDEPDADEPLRVDRISFVYAWEHLKGFDAALDPDETVDFRRALAVLFEVTVPVEGGRYDATVDARVENADGSTLADERFSFADSENERGSVIRRERVVLDRSAAEPGDVEAAVELADELGGETARETGRLRLGREAASSSAARVERHLDDARIAIAEGVALFRERAGGDLTDATAESDVDLRGVIDAALPADGELREARRRRVSGYGDAIDRIRAEYDLVTRLVRAQRRTSDVIRTVRELYRELGTESSRIGAAFNDYRDAVDEVTSRTVDGDGSVSALATELEGSRTVYDYGPKVEGLRAEAEVFERWREAALRTRDGLDPLERAREEYERENDGRAADAAEEALEAFGDAIEELEAVDRFPETGDRLLGRLDDLVFEAETVRRRASGRLEE